ncbi:btb/poz domain-containing protein [Anaeramoeba ignava]|uniref:Btb/poz domain-containing protein n=1 Tax=Anaeramoeba ignava TaxID=1746090 RepID=A0A9Q0LBZ5_ANAIG|nr:btb/poz domain-containing protein [Anaeramoeba ignava]
MFKLKPEYYGVYECNYKWGGMHGIWRGSLEVEIYTDNGKIFVNQKPVRNITMEEEKIIWKRDPNEPNAYCTGASTNGSITFKMKEDSVYYFKKPQIGPLFIGSIQNTGEGPLDFRGVMKKPYSFGLANDFLNVYQSKIQTDFSISCLDGIFTLNRLICKIRLGSHFENFCAFLGEETKSDLEPFMRWIYCGFFENDKEEEKGKKIASKIGFTNFEKEISIAKFNIDISGLLKDENSKDFTIILSNGELVKTHKIILAARSELYRHMFESVVDNSESVPETTNKTSQAFHIFLDSFYTDKIPNEISKSIKEELSDVSEFFQLTSSLQYLFEKLN